MAQSKQKGICPHCGSTEIEIIDVQDDGYCTEHHCKCKECKSKFKETYYLDYSHTEYEDGNKMYLKEVNANNKRIIGSLQ